MTRPNIITALVAMVLIGASGYGAYQFGISRGMKAGSAAAQPGKQVLYWHDPMVPGTRFDKPGKSPFMDMQLVPVYAGEAADEGTVRISPRVRQNLGMRIVEVSQGSLGTGMQMVGSIAFNERDAVLVQARGNGYVERLLARAPLEAVRKGQPLLQLYVPDWVAAQEEYLSIRRMNASAASAGLLDAALQRMRLAGMTDEQVRQVAASGKVAARVTVNAPVAGIITELGAREGMTVAPGAQLFRINGMRTVWVNAEVPESAAAQVRPGMPVEASTAAFPGLVFRGKVEAILPQVDAATRTLKARIELANPAGQLVPGMFATVRLTPAARPQALLLPSEAVIQTGTRSVVMVALEDGSFKPVDVVVGAEANGQAEIREGLVIGQKVVASGQFLIDSEASLRSTAQRPAEAPSAAAPGGPTHPGTGKVEKISANAVTISHGPIPGLRWGPMTMDFAAPAAGMPANIRVGDKVVFEIRATSDGAFQIVTIAPAPGAAK